MKYYYSGKGLLTTPIKNLGLEAHLQGYVLCGPATRLRERLTRGDQPINKEDALSSTWYIVWSGKRDQVATSVNV